MEGRFVTNPAGELQTAPVLVTEDSRKHRERLNLQLLDPEGFDMLSTSDEG